LDHAFPHSTAFLPGLGHCTQNLALIHGHAGEPARAVELLREALAVRERAWEAERGRPAGPSFDTRKHLAYTLVRLAEACRVADLRGEAENCLRRARGLLDGISAADRAKPEVIDDWALYHLAAGRLAADPGAALAEFAAAVTHAEKGVSVPEYARHLAETLTERGAAHAAAGHSASALADLGRAVTVAADVTTRQPGMWEHEAALAAAEYQYGRVLAAAGKRQEAWEQLARSAAHWDAMSARAPGRPDFKAGAATARLEAALLY
jgi:tetratricopeptide (TPR) repeat protein